LTLAQERRRRRGEGEEEEEERLWLASLEVIASGSATSGHSRRQEHQDNTNCLVERHLLVEHQDNKTC